MFDNIEIYLMHSLVLIFQKAVKNVVQNIFTHIHFWNKENIFFFKWVNKIFWVVAILVGRSKRENKQYFNLNLNMYSSLANRVCVGHLLDLRTQTHSNPLETLLTSHQTLLQSGRVSLTHDGTPNYVINSVNTQSE
jgi:hypothetical protein